MNYIEIFLLSIVGGTLLGLFLALAKDSLK